VRPLKGGVIVPAPVPIKTDATASIVIPVQVLIERAARSRLEIGTERRIRNEYRAASPVAAVGPMTSYMIVGKARLAACLAIGGGRARLLAPVASHSQTNRAQPVDGRVPGQPRAKG
jgi:hypothetical protein